MIKKEPPLPLLTRVIERISWDEYMRRIRELPIEDQSKVAARAAKVVASAK